MLAADALFLIAGLAFGYATEGRAKLLPLLFPLALSIGAIVGSGVDGAVLVRLALALAVTAIGIVLGHALDERGGRREAAA
jgi:hypothetical protein